MFNIRWQVWQLLKLAIKYLIVTINHKFLKIKHNTAFLNIRIVHWAACVWFFFHVPLIKMIVTFYAAWQHIPHVQTGSRLPGDSLERPYLFYDRPSTLYSNVPAFRGQSQLKWFWPCIRSCTHFDENSCALSITSPRSLFRPRTQQVWWDHWEKSRRASTLWDCRGKSHLAGLSPVNGT